MNIDKEWEKKRSCFYNFKCILKIRLYLIVANQHIRDLTLKISLKYKIWMNYCFKFWDGFWVWLGDVDWTRGSACTSWLSLGEQWTSLPHWPAVQGAWFGQWKVCSSDVCHFLLEALKSSLCLSMIPFPSATLFQDSSSVSWGHELQIWWGNPWAYFWWICSIICLRHWDFGILCYCSLRQPILSDTTLISRLLKPLEIKSL